MDRQSQIQLAERFRAMHDRGHVLLLPNAWDPGSARMLEVLGFDAIATTSAGVAWSLGYADGEQLAVDDVLSVVRGITRVTSIPITVDFETGFADSPEGVAANVRALVEAGAVGLNLEDSIQHDTLRSADDAARRIAAVRALAVELGVPLVINARIDTWIALRAATEAERIAETLRRARVYLAAGADLIYPIGVSDPRTIGELCAGIGAPVNIGARPGLPDLVELSRLGVARVTTATRLATIAMSAARDAARHLRESGRFDRLDSSFTFDDAQQLFGTS